VNRFVLDASVAVAWVAGMPIEPYAAAVQMHVANGWRAIVPSLWQVEVANALLMVERRRVLTAADVDRGLLDLETFLASRAELDQTPVAMRQAADLARMFQLTVYDAVYMELAKRESVPLATLDKSLRAAATKAGVALLK
jgi:predicted nucleic acid-binding protein